MGASYQRRTTVHCTAASEPIIFIADHGMTQQVALLNLAYDPSEPVERNAEYEVILRRKVAGHNGERKET